METQNITVEAARPDLDRLREAADALKAGGTVAFPTETVYGLGADALNPDAVARIFAAKGRPSDNPLIVHIAARETLLDLVREVPPEAEKLIERFWPGPLTIVLPKRPRVPDAVTAGLGTVAVRMPDHDVALALIALAGVPVAAPSANRSGRPSPTTAAHVREDMDGRIDVIVDGGPSGIGVESTVVDLTTRPATLLRPGGVTREELIAVLGELSVDPALSPGVDASVTPRSPGLKYTHYAPRAPLTLVVPSARETGPLLTRVWELAEMSLAAGVEGREGQLDQLGKVDGPKGRVGLLALTEDAAWFRDRAASRGWGVEMDGTGASEARCQGTLVIVPAGSRARPAEVATRLFAALRRFDDLGVDAIIAEGLAEEGLGFAVMNRLRKAAGGRISVAMPY